MMGPIERSLKSVLQLMQEGGYNPKGGDPVPIEDIHAANIISHDTYLALLREMEAERRNFARSQTASEMGAESDELAERMVKAGAPSMYANATKDLTQSQTLAQGQWVYVYGQDMDAVTRKACGLMKGWMSENPYGRVKYTRSASMVSSLRDARSEQDVMRDLAGVGLLVISGLGNENPTDWTLSKLWETFDYRFGDGRPMVVATQYPPQVLASQMSGRGNDNAARQIVEMLRSRSVLVQV